MDSLYKGWSLRGCASAAVAQLSPSQRASDRQRSSIAHWPERLSPPRFYPLAYRFMYLSRQLDEKLLELFKKGYCKGTVTIGSGNEATAVGMSMPFRPGRDPVCLLHRDLASHLVLGVAPYQLVSQYLANADSPTHGREGNVHHGEAGSRRLPMISHLGSMLALAVGATWAARQNGEEVFGLAVIGDGGTSTGEFHEALNIAAVHRVPVIFVVENNFYAFSTPTSAQYRCDRLSDRAVGYGMEGCTIDGTDVWQVYETVCDALDAMRVDPSPKLIECMTIRLHGHAAYDKAEYVPRELQEEFRRRDCLPEARRKLQEVCAWSESEIEELERAVDEELQQAVVSALGAPRPDPRTHHWEVYVNSPPPRVEPFRAKKARNGEAVYHALNYILSRQPRAFMVGLDIGAYGSAFKTCKGLVQRYGPNRVIDMPLAESGIVGFALGASQAGGRPIVEFQFADFSTEATTQLGLNAGTWYYRAGEPAPILVRLPCGGGLTMGAFHSGEYEGLWSRFCGLKLLYPATAQETFEALLAGFYDDNPCLVFEHKLLYWSRSGEIDFDGDLAAVWRPRRYTQGDRVTAVAFGAMVFETLEAAADFDRAVEVWNPFVLQPLDLSPILESVERTGRLLVVQESPESQGFGDRIISHLVRQGARLRCRPRLVSAPNTPVPFAPELESHYRPNAARIHAAIEQLLGEG